MRLLRASRHPALSSLGAVSLAAVVLLFPASRSFSALSVTPVRGLTAEAMAAKIHGNVPQIRIGNASAPSTITATLCHGLGPPHDGRYETFRCRATWNGGTSTVWARALPGGRFCASATGLAACPAAAPRAGDPRICSLQGAPPTADPNECALGESELALVRAMKTNFGDPTWLMRNATCTGSNLRFRCTFSSHTAYGVYYTSTIAFMLAGGRWAATIATSGAGASSVCSVEPDPATAAGAPSLWGSGPVPVCTH